MGNNGKCVLEDVNPYSHAANAGFSLRQGMPESFNPDGFKCICEEGFRGPRCEEIDPCSPNPCQHASQCVLTNDHKIAAYNCNCSDGWKGNHCESVNLCTPDPCRFGTHCIQTDEESYQCVKNLCTPNPCKHDGKCIVVNDEGYECACPKGWKGKNCDEQ